MKLNSRSMYIEIEIEIELSLRTNIVIELETEFNTNIYWDWNWDWIAGWIQYQYKLILRLTPKTWHCLAIYAGCIQTWPKEVAQNCFLLILPSISSHFAHFSMFFHHLLHSSVGNIYWYCQYFSYWDWGWDWVCIQPKNWDWIWNLILYQ